MQLFSPFPKPFVVFFLFFESFCVLKVLFRLEKVVSLVLKTLESVSFYFFQFYFFKDMFSVSEIFYEININCNSMQKN